MTTLHIHDRQEHDSLNLAAEDYASPSVSKWLDRIEGTDYPLSEPVPQDIKQALIDLYLVWHLTSNEPFKTEIK